MDLDRFKQINDTLGHHVGDRILCAAAALIERAVADTLSTHEALTAEVRSKVLLARVSGNGFAILLHDLHFHKKADVAGALARRVNNLFNDTLPVDSHEVFVTASIGVAISPADGEDADMLLKHAEMAMYQAKKRGRNCCEFFSDQINARARERSTLEHQLRRAVEREELVLLYQPKVDVASGRIKGAEALIRWAHPDLGMVSPIKFIPIAEETGLIVEIGQWVLRSACVQATKWMEQGLLDLSISVNVSAEQFKQRKVWHAVSGALAHSGLPAGQLVLELTETMLMENASDSVGMLRELKQMGVKVSIDDFGTGYSSLSYLSHFPLDELKIDRSFVRGLGTNKHSMPIVGAIIALARELGLTIVAEGVETKTQLQFLKDRQCDVYQGYLCSRPAPADLFAGIVRRANGITGREHATPLSPPAFSDARHSA
ncbi:MAG: bifunctional diguanylate cyclase/phosphodiesterase [Nitrosospira sp.]